MQNVLVKMSTVGEQDITTNIESSTANSVNNDNINNLNNINKSYQPWYYFLVGVLFTIAIWLTAKVFAWLIPGFRSFYNRIFVVNTVSLL